jgi:hypothetical protein
MHIFMELSHFWPAGQMLIHIFMAASYRWPAGHETGFGFGIGRGFASLACAEKINPTTIAAA